MAAGQTPYRSVPAWKISAASGSRSTGRRQKSSSIATQVGEQIRDAIAAGASIWLRAGTSRRAPTPAGDDEVDGARAGEVESETIHGAASTAAGSDARKRSRTRTPSTGAGVRNTSTSTSSPGAEGVGSNDA